MTPREERLERVLELAKQGHGAQRISSALGIASATATRDLAKLRSDGQLPARALGDNRTNVPALPESSTPGETEPLKDVLLRTIQKRKDGTHTIDELCDMLDVAPGRLRAALHDLESTGYNVYVDGGVVALTRGEAAESNEPSVATGDLRFGIISDTHLACRAERLDVLDALYDWYAAEGISTVYHAGNMIEGESRFNVRERTHHGLDAQVDYFIERYPARPGIVTRYVTGDDHEGWYQQREGISIGRYIQQRAEDAGRTDLQYLGFLEHDIAFRNGVGEFVMRVSHPGGGSAYALSYTPQKIVESYSSGEKPAILILGHYHKMEYIPAVRGVRVIQAGCCVDQGVWARKKRLAYHLGGWILGLTQCPRTGALIGCTAEDRTFFDKAFYKDWERLEAVG